jgi:tetratricopeptide (TPR) repeat protein
LFALAQTSVARKAYGEAVSLLDRAGGLADWYGMDSERAGLLALTGRPAEARTLLERLLARGKSEYVDPYTIAIVYVALGDHDHAFEWLNRAIDAHSAYAAFFNGDPKLAPLHGDKQFAALITRIGL